VEVPGGAKGSIVTVATIALSVAAIAVIAVDTVLFGLLVRPAVLVRRRLGGRGVAVMRPHQAAVPSFADEQALADGVPMATYNRVVRFAAWAYILFTALFVGATHLWPERQPAIFAVLAVAGALVFLVHDVLPDGRLRRVKFLLEGLIAVILVTIIVILTDGLRSPFFFAYPLVVAGAALVAPPPVTFGLAALATSAYLVGAASTSPGRVDTTSVAIAGINVAALVLLTYVAVAIAREQRRTRAAAIRLSTIDALTGLANRAYLLASLESEIDRGKRYDRGFCLLMADLDGLKVINDTFGHWTGDRVLVAVAEVIREGTRRIDVAARLSGDEFVVLLPETDPTGAFVVAEKIRQGVAELRISAQAELVPLSVSVGVVAWPDAGPTVDDVMASVDAAMYASKRRGRNRVAGPDETPPVDERGSRPAGPGPNSQRTEDAPVHQAVEVVLRDFDAEAYLWNGRETGIRTGAAPGGVPATTTSGGA
jgi:diguanylate cyclase (GGDEF)-like protein